MYHGAVGRGLGRANRPTSDLEILELAAGVYDAAIQPELWQAWLEALCRALAAPVGGLFLHFRPGIGVGGYYAVGVKPDLRGWFLEGPVKDRSLLGSALDLPPGEVSVVSESVPGRLFLGSRFYREWMYPQGLRHCIACILERTPESMAAIGLMRRRGAPGFGEAELDRVRRLAPHLQRAVRLQGMQALSALEREAGERIGDALRIGAVLVHVSGRVLAANRRASALLAAPNGPRLKDGRLVARTPAETRALHDLIAGAARPKADPRAGAGGALVLSRPEGPPLVVLVSPLRMGEGRPARAELAVALVVLRAPEDVPMPSETALRSLFALTPAEARVACLLAGGATVDEIAGALDVRVTTVRSHVQKLLDKTGTRRQSELVRLLVSGPWLAA